MIIENDGFMIMSMEFIWNKYNDLRFNEIHVIAWICLDSRKHSHKHLYMNEINATCFLNRVQKTVILIYVRYFSMFFFVSNTNIRNVLKHKAVSRYLRSAIISSYMYIDNL